MRHTHQLEIDAVFERAKQRAREIDVSKTPKKRKPVPEGWVMGSMITGVFLFVVFGAALYRTIQRGDVGAFAVTLLVALPLVFCGSVVVLAFLRGIAR